MAKRKKLKHHSQETKLEVLNLAATVGQKIDVIWVTFLTTYLALFGFAIFYSGKVEKIYFAFIIFAVLAFTWINFKSLWHHYRTQNELGRVFKKMNREFPSLNDRLQMFYQPGSEYLLIITHLAGAGFFLYFLFDKFWTG